MKNLKKNDTNELINNTETHRLREQNYSYQREGMRGEGEWELGLTCTHRCIKNR